MQSDSLRIMEIMCGLLGVMLGRWRVLWMNRRPWRVGGRARELTISATAFGCSRSVTKQRHPPMPRFPLGEGGRGIHAVRQRHTLRTADGRLDNK